jgi:hypothetical protein
MIKDLIKRLTSRKFLLALGAFVTLCAEKQYVAASAVVAAYLGVQGVNDFRNAS